MLVLYLLLVIFLLCFTKYLWQRRWLYYHAANIKGPLAFPFFGSSYALLAAKKDNLAFLNKLFETYGSICKLWLGPRLILFTNDATYAKIILNECVEKEASYAAFGKCLIGEGIFTARTPKWKRNRKIIALLFNTKKLNNFFDVFVRHSHNLVRKFENNIGKGFVDIFPTIQQSTIDIICELALNSKSNNEKYGYWMFRAETLLFLRFFVFYLHPDFIWKMTSRYREVRKLTDNAWDFVRQIVEKRGEPNPNNNEKAIDEPKCFLEDLTTLTKHKFTNAELIEEIQTLIVAASGTTSTTEATVLLMLALFQDIQDKVYVELKEVLGSTERQIVLEDLTQLKYLDCVIKETLRLFPAAPAFARTVEKDLQLDKSTIIPKGSSVIIPLISIHRNAKYWPDPLKFDPERFLTQQPEHSYAFMPFAAGPRNCIGMRYAMMALKVMVASVVQRFRIVATDYSGVEDIRLHFKIVAKFPRGHKIVLQHREAN